MRSFIIICLILLPSLGFSQYHVKHGKSPNSVKHTKIVHKSKVSDLFSEEQQGQLMTDAMTNLSGQFGITKQMCYFNSTISVDTSNSFNGEEELGIAYKDLQASLIFDYSFNLDFQPIEYYGFRQQYTIKFSKKLNVSLALVESFPFDKDFESMFIESVDFFYDVRGKFFIDFSMTLTEQSNIFIPSMTINLVKIFKFNKK